MKTFYIFADIFRKEEKYFLTHIISISQTKIELVSHLDNVPNYLVGCIIQKRYLHFRDAEVLVTSMFGLLETVVKMTIVIAMAMPLQCGQFQSILLSIRVKMHITTKVVPQL